MASSTSRGARPKHVPLRTCVACREPDAKRELVRIVRTPAGKVLVDLTGKLSGRGAYLCRRRACWDLAARKRIVEHALHTALSADDKAAIEQFGSSLPE